jgi:hypothetical protein
MKFSGVMSQYIESLDLGRLLLIIPKLIEHNFVFHKLQIANEAFKTSISTVFGQYRAEQIEVKGKCK